MYICKDNQQTLYYDLFMFIVTYHCMADMAHARPSSGTSEM